MHVPVGDREEVVDRACQCLSGKIMESLSQILPFHFTGVETKAGQVE